MRPTYQGPAVRGPANLAAAARNMPPDANALDRPLLFAVRYANEADFVALMSKAVKQGARLDANDEAGRSLLELAVQRNSVRIAQALLAAGAPLPNVDPSGFDILMQAASSGHAEMVAFLVEGPGMSVAEEDATGQTALHHAVKSCATTTIRTLLERGANCNAAAYEMDAAELVEIFGQRNGLANDGVTPLAIAVAKHDLPSVELLLEHGATISDNVRNPLWIAIRRQDTAMLEVLLKHCGRTARVSAVVSQAILESTLVANERTQLLRQLLDCRRLHPMNAVDLDSALATAVSLGHIDQAALLIEQGACPDSPTTTENSLWTTAAEQHDSAMLDVLTASRKARFNALLETQQHGRPALLIELCTLAKHPLDLAAHGIFESTIRPALPQLRDLAGEVNCMTPAQVAVKTAHLLKQCIHLVAGEGEASDFHAPVEKAVISAGELQRQRPRAGHAQGQAINDTIAARRRALHHLIDATMQELKTALATSLSAEALLLARRQSGQAGTEYTLWQTLQATHGLPDQLADLIAQTWVDSENMIASQASGSALPDAQAVSRLMSSFLFCKLQTLPTDDAPLSHHCKHLLVDLLSAQRAPLLSLVRQPASFLRALEHRQGLRPVNVPMLVRSLASTTGLPEATCDALANCWRQAVTEASREPDDGTGGDLVRLLERAFARHWQAWLAHHADAPGSSALPLTAQEITAAIDWCDLVLGTPAGTLKRKAESEADDAPPTKPSRLD